MNNIINKMDRKVKLKKKKDTINISVKSTHNAKIEYFEHLQTVVLKQKKKELEITKNPSKIEILKKEIKDIEDRVEETDYFFKTAKLLDEYFILDENIKKDVRNEQGVSRKNIVIQEYYNVLGMVDIPKSFYKNLKIYDASSCSNCKSEKLIETVESGVICENCGTAKEGQLNFSKELSYDEKCETFFQPKIDYKRVDYFKQWLKQIQAKEQISIPQEVMDNVILQIKIERIKKISSINYATMKKILKKTDNARYYEHIPYIINTINNIQPLIIPANIENKLVDMFLEIQVPWENLKSKERKNFFSYPYTIHKFCQILELDEYLPYFSLLKSREKLYKQDILWKQIIEYFQSHECINKENMKDVNWRFISSF